MLKSHYKILCLGFGFPRQTNTTWNQDSVFQVVWKHGLVSTRVWLKKKKKQKTNTQTNQAPELIWKEPKRLQLLTPLLFHFFMVGTSFFFPLHHLKGQTLSGTSVIGRGVKSEYQSSPQSYFMHKHWTCFYLRTGLNVAFYQHMQSCCALRPQQHTDTQLHSRTLGLITQA